MKPDQQSPRVDPALEPARAQLRPGELQSQPRSSPTNAALPRSGKRTISKASRANSHSNSASRVTSLRPVVIGISAAVLLAGLAFGGRLWMNSIATEEAHSNWKWVQMATDQSVASGETRIVVVGKDGQPKVATSMGLAQNQRDTSTTANVSSALKTGDTRQATRAIIDAQKIPDVATPALHPVTGEKLVPKIAAPTLTEGMKAELLQGDVQFFHLYLFDTCAEDGDVVELYVDGQLFAQVPITHSGATLSIPMAAGRVTALALRGVYDGGGGITIGFRSSDGDAFVGVMAVDQVVQLGTVGS